MINNLLQHSLSNESDELSEKFINGLMKYNLNLIDLVNFKYCGGDSGSHKNYFNLFFQGAQENKPNHVNHCICGNRIKINCYITNAAQILVLGNCCIKKFISKSGRTCDTCGEPHKNRKVNRCNTCRTGVCDLCDGVCGKRYKTCFVCSRKKNNDIESEFVIGKYKGQKYEDVFKKDKGYINWVLKQEGFLGREFILKSIVK
jgi:hypothetical protein